MTRIAMIPARMGSQRLKQKNLRELAGVPLITRAIRKCKATGLFDEIWVNSEHPDFGPIAEAEGVAFHRRPEDLGSNAATSEQYIDEFFRAHPCELLFQVHSIAPLLTASEVAAFVQFMAESDFDALLSYIPEQIECALDGHPVNFTYDEKTNSQDLDPFSGSPGASPAGGGRRISPRSTRAAAPPTPARSATIPSTRSRGT